MYTVGRRTFFSTKKYDIKQPLLIDQMYSKLSKITKLDGSYTLIQIVHNICRPHNILPASALFRIIKVYCLLRSGDTG